jgi:hypothetical protein
MLLHRRLPSNSCIERAPHASDTALAFTDNDGALNTSGKPFIFQESLGFRNCAEDFD